MQPTVFDTRQTDISFVSAEGGRMVLKAGWLVAGGRVDYNEGSFMVAWHFDSSVANLPFALQYKMTIRAALYIGPYDLLYITGAETQTAASDGQISLTFKITKDQLNLARESK